ncbi:MAG TPA: carbohydrate binding family 9 domain-containing protein, partial [Thermoanaerobaculia bacterium]|nr:carbohydrate binding family 9 domain-containing protein [Thermoanaerobaculia bacterium]
MRSRLRSLVLLGCAVFVPLHLAAIETPRLAIRRATGPITIDGDLSDPAWKDAVRVDTFWETKRGDNAQPPVPTVARLAYDDRYFYAAFEFFDPHPEAIRAPLGDHDGISGDTDYGGVILDARNDGKTAVLFLANPHNVQYDALTNDASGEDSSPDYFWDSAARIVKDGWVLEMRIPFSSLRYNRSDPQTWGILLYRNYPRDFHYQMFSAPLPRGSNCFICHENK